MTFDANMLLQAAHHVAGSQQYPKGALYLVATPIGNLADMSLRSLHVLGLVDVVACEDTRVTGNLLRHLGLDKKLIALHQHNEVGSAQGVVALMQEGQRVAYVSDAGTPAVSDPGAHLVQAAHAAGLTVVPLPGASSVTTAMSAAGDAQANGFRFVGFLPSKGAARVSVLQAVLGGRDSVVLFEAPHRIETLAKELGEVLPQGQVTICRELTKQFESITKLDIAEMSAWLKGDPNRLRGEFVLVVHGVPRADEEGQTLSPAMDALLKELVRHVPVKLAAGLVADAAGMPKKALYDHALAHRNADDPDDLS
ncbi:16S rRNA (cytidine(1402)-2'-O)-methyltransferase [Aquabacterium sp.]|uniref:16S rRNA (cytidine(1402)-2'-O)-methyltransferase n=1 Tax=Aquabacterium sp. TaxID=1872578 RepID=UPI00345C2403